MAESIPVNQGTLRDDEFEWDGICQKEIRRGREPLHRKLHRQPRGVIDVDAIDNGRIYRRNRPGNCALADAFGQNFPPLGLELLAVVQAANGAAG